MERLCDQPEVVETLKSILEKDAPYLEYDEFISKLSSKKNDCLYVKGKIDDGNHKLDENVIKDICKKLTEAIGIPLRHEVETCSGQFYKGLDLKHNSYTKSGKFYRI